MSYGSEELIEGATKFRDGFCCRGRSVCLPRANIRRRRANTQVRPYDLAAFSRQQFIVPDRFVSTAHDFEIVLEEGVGIHLDADAVGALLRCMVYLRFASNLGEIDL